MVEQAVKVSPTSSLARVVQAVLENKLSNLCTHITTRQTDEAIQVKCIAKPITTGNPTRLFKGPQNQVMNYLARAHVVKILSDQTVSLVYMNTPVKIKFTQP